MDVVTREERLSNLLAFQEVDLPRQVEWFLYRRKQVRLGSILTGMAGCERTRAIYAYFVKRDVTALRQNCYLATKLILASVDEDGGASFSVGGDFLYALLSDNRDVINALARVETPELLKERHNPLSSRSHVYMLQLAIRGEDEILEEMIAKFAKNGRKAKRSEAAEGKDFFSLLLQRDRVGLQELIQTKHAQIKSANPYEEDFMSFLGTLEAKLCWFKGIPVEINSPLVPMELMALKPLERYDDVYDFLKPGWVPPRQGLLGKVSRWMSGKE